jgi:hypothetical protein
MEILTIEELILALNTCAIGKSESCYLDALKNMQIPHADWERYFTFRENEPGRVRLFKTEHFELFLTCWEKGQQGPIHDIDSVEAWIHPICGQFIEERYRKLKEKKGLQQVSSILLNSQSYSHMQDTKTIYKYINSYENRSVCLHLYSHPIVEWREYDKSTGKVELVEHKFDNEINEYDHLKS